jgi:hypothetical protein
MAPFPFIYDGIARELFILGLDFRLVIEPGYLTVALPKLDVMAINKLLGLLFGVSITSLHSSGTALKKCPSTPII